MYYPVPLRFHYFGISQFKQFYYFPYLTWPILIGQHGTFKAWPDYSYVQSRAWQWIFVRRKSVVASLRAFMVEVKEETLASALDQDIQEIITKLDFYCFMRQKRWLITKSFPTEAQQNCQHDFARDDTVIHTVNDWALVNYPNKGTIQGRNL